MASRMAPKCRRTCPAWPMRAASCWRPRSVWYAHGLTPEVPMIPRYSRPEMTAIWDPQSRFRIWFEIEAHASDAMAELGIIPKQAAYTIWEKARHATFDVARIDA